MGTESSDTGFERQPQGVIGRSRRRLKGPLWLQVLFRCFLAPLLLPSQVVAGIQQDTVDPGRERRKQISWALGCQPNVFSSSKASPPIPFFFAPNPLDAKEPRNVKDVKEICGVTAVCRWRFQTAQAAGNHTNRRRDASATKRLTSTEARAQSRFSCETGCSHAR